MNRIHFSGFFASFLVSLLISQSSTAQMRTQIHLGLTRTTLTGKSNSDFSAASKFSAGVGLGFAISGGVFIQPEVVYSVKGASVDGAEDLFPEVEGGIRARVTLTYLEFPLLLGYQFGGVSIRPRIYAGPYLAYKLRAKISFEAQAGGPSFTDTDDSVVDWDSGFVLGGAIHFPFGDEEFAIGARASIGLTDVTEATDGEDLEQSLSNLSNQSIGIYASVLF